MEVMQILGFKEVRRGVATLVDQGVSTYLIRNLVKQAITLFQADLSSKWRNILTFIEEV
jgi:hypothetical protein